MEVNRKISLHYENIRRKNEEILKNRKKEIYRNIPQIAEIDKYINQLGLKSCKSLFLKPSSSIVMDVTREISDLKKEKERLLTENGYDINYLSMPYDGKYFKNKRNI